MAVLVAYATAGGSTRGVAERIATGLEGCGTVELRNSTEVDSLRRYEALIIGSAIHNGQWLPAAAETVERLRAELEGRTVWAFSVSSVGATSTTLSPRLARYLRRATPEPKAVQDLRSVADVCDHRFFAGAITPGDWPGFGRIVFRLMGGHYGDARDWDDIDEWTGRIRTQLVENPM
ncbi:flavodoxin domain-containing protein [Rhodococcus sp. NPDC047139]|uniref:flavodoxin domain-containing protein n=1 Tax=Rhodococcus sp. NPDC047139 TaxID=3155141 RepID=UPI003400E602